VESGVEKSVDGIPLEVRYISSAFYPPPEVALAEYESKQRTENVEDGKALLFTSAKLCQSFSKRDSFAKSLKFGKGLDRIVFMV
jgi:hypothetical protein